VGRRTVVFARERDAWRIIHLHGSNIATPVARLAKFGSSQFRESTMRSVRYNVAASLDGYIADPNGGYDWIPIEPAIDFAALFRNVDTVLLGRHSYELVLRDPAAATWPRGARVIVFSRTLRQSDHPDVTVTAEVAATVVAGLRAESSGGDIWLYGGGTLFGSLLAAGQVDRVEVTLIPILLGGGVPLLPPDQIRAPLALEHVERYPSGQVSLHYTVTTARRPNE
jgi:dihydrofolate reductase